MTINTRREHDYWDPARKGFITNYPNGHSSVGDYSARMFFFDGSAVREDPATGSANSAFAAYLHKLGHSGDVVVEQGYEMGRASRIYAQLGATLRVGGRVQEFARGTLVP